MGSNRDSPGKNSGEKANYIYALPATSYIYHWGGRWEPQFNIGMWADVRQRHYDVHSPLKQYLRIGMGFNCTLEGADVRREEHREEIIRNYYHLKHLLAQIEFRVRFRTWLVDQNAWLEHAEGFRRLNQSRSIPDPARDPDKMIEWFEHVNPEIQAWTFWGRLLRPDVEADRHILSDPAQLLSAVDAAFATLRPIWQEIMTLHLWRRNSLLQ